MGELWSLLGFSVVDVVACAVLVVFCLWRGRTAGLRAGYRAGFEDGRRSLLRRVGP